jgi:hypothetical protein
MNGGDMTTKQIENVEPMEDRNAFLEKTLIQEYLHEKFYSLETLGELPAEVAQSLMRGASQYASLKMEEVEARAHFVQELHDDASSL